MSTSCISQVMNLTHEILILEMHIQFFFLTIFPKKFIDYFAEHTSLNINQTDYSKTFYDSETDTQ